MLSIVATAYKEKLEANVFLNSLLLQNNPNWECIVYADEPNEYIKNLVTSINDGRITYFENKKAKGFWGHDNRKYALENLVKGDFVLQASIQDYYIPVAVELIIQHMNDFDFVFFDCIHNGFGYEILHSQPRVCGIDWSSFVIKTDIAKKIGINDTQLGVTDGLFVERIMRYPNLKWYKINKILTIHN